MVEYIFFYKDIIVGGCELLIEKVSKQIVKLGDAGETRVKVLCNAIDGGMLERFKGSGVEICQISNWESNKELRDYISSENEVRMVAFFWEDFVRLYYLKNKKMKTILYAVHFQVLAVGANCRFPFLKQLLQIIGGKCIYELLLAGKILCMDEQTVRYTQNYFRKAFLEDTSIYKIVRIPINEVAVKREQLEKRAQATEFNVLAIARAEFPFKGYLLGLIDFIAGQESKENLHLDIISYGPDIDILERKVKALDEETKKIITLHGKVDYDALGQFYDKAKLYIGMGTTVLDAAQRGIISIPVVPYTEELTADKFFHEDGSVLAVDRKLPNYIINLWNEVRGLDSGKYSEFSEKSRDAVKRFYRVEKTVQQIINIFSVADDDRFSLKICFFKYLNSVQYLLYQKFYKKVR